MTADLDVSPYLKAARTIPDEEGKAEVLARLEVTLGLGPPGAVGSGRSAVDGAHASAGAASASASAAALAKGAALVLVGVIFGAGGMAAVRPRSTVVVEQPRAAGVVVRAIEASPAATSAIAAVTPPVTPSMLPAARATSTPVPVVASSNDPSGALEAERTLLETARTAILRGDATNALAALEQHRVRFAHGQLSEERESLAVHALVLAGRTDEARARAARFGRTYPRSLQLAAVETLVRELERVDAR